MEKIEEKNGIQYHIRIEEVKQGQCFLSVRAVQRKTKVKRSKFGDWFRGLFPSGTFFDMIHIQ